MIMRYWHLAKVAFQEVTVYPARVIGILGVRMMTWLSFLVLWRVIYSERELVGTYTLADMVTYYSLALIITELTRVWTVTRQFADFVHKGTLSMWLLKPVRISPALFTTFLAERACYTIFPTLLFVGAIFFKPALFQMPHHLFYFFVSLILSVLLAHLMCSLVGIAAFWLTQTNGLRNVFARLMEVLGGMIFPIELLPEGIRKNLLDFLPFQFTQFIPISIYMGKLGDRSISELLMLQLLWVGVFAVFYWLVWEKGIKKYEAVGH